MARILFTSKAGGFSRPPFDSFNLALHVSDNPLDVEVNRKELVREFSVSRVIYMDQTHSNVVAVVDEETQESPSADALFTRTKGIALAVLVADCIPLLLHSIDAVAAVHVGRRGMTNGIIQKVVNTFRTYSDAPISADLGPSICDKCYEVDLQMYQEVIGSVPASATSIERHCLDLPSGVTSILNSLDITSKSWSVCTRESSNHFSYRRNAITGRQAGVVAL